MAAGLLVTTVALVGWQLSQQQHQSDEAFPLVGASESSTPMSTPTISAETVPSTDPVTEAQPAADLTQSVESQPTPIAKPTKPKEVKKVAPKPPPTPRLPTCRDLSRNIVASYTMQHELSDPEIGMVDYWPKVTVKNHWNQPVTVTFEGRGSATDHVTGTPLEMVWGADDGTVSTNPGHSSTVVLGHDFGAVLSVFQGEHILSLSMSATAATDSGELSDCPIRVTRR